MDRGKIVPMAVVLSIFGGALNLLISAIRLSMGPSLWFLTSLSGLITITTAIFLYWAPQNRVLWGGIMLVYSSLGFIAFGLTSETHLLPYGFATLIFGTLGGLLSLSGK